MAKSLKVFFLYSGRFLFFLLQGLGYSSVCMIFGGTLFCIVMDLLAIQTRLFPWWYAHFLPVLYYTIPPLTIIYAITFTFFLKKNPSDVM